MYVFELICLRILTHQSPTSKELSKGISLRFVIPLRRARVLNLKLASKL